MCLLTSCVNKFQNPGVSKPNIFFIVVGGLSLKPLLQGDQINGHPLFWCNLHYGSHGGEPVSFIRKGNWKLINYPELFNLEGDLGEKNN